MIKQLISIFKSGILPSAPVVKEEYEEVLKNHELNYILKNKS